MPNPQGAYGLKPIRHLSGGEIRNNAYPIASGYATSLFTGDVVKAAADGSIQQAAPADAALGVFAGCKWTGQDGSVEFSSYWPASTVGTNIEALVYDDPDIVFRIRSDATGITAAEVHGQADYANAAGNVKTGVSGLKLDAAGTVAATGKALRIMAIINDGYNLPGPYTEAEVVFAEHALKGVVAGVGGA